VWIRIKIVYWINSNKSYITLHKHVYQLYMLSYQIPSYKTSNHIKTEVHSVTFILYEGIRYHNLYSWFSIIHVPKYVISLQYIRVAPSNYTNCLTSEMVNSNCLNNSSQAFTRKFYYSIRNIKFLLGLV